MVAFASDENISPVEVSVLKLKDGLCDCQRTRHLKKDASGFLRCPDLEIFQAFSSISELKQEILLVGSEVVWPVIFTLLPGVKIVPLLQEPLVVGALNVM